MSQFDFYTCLWQKSLIISFFSASLKSQNQIMSQTCSLNKGAGVAPQEIQHLVRFHCGTANIKIIGGENRKDVKGIFALNIHQIGSGLFFPAWKLLSSFWFVNAVCSASFLDLDASYSITGYKKWYNNLIHFALKVIHYCLKNVTTPFVSYNSIHLNDLHRIRYHLFISKLGFPPRRSSSMLTVTTNVCLYHNSNTKHWKSIIQMNVNMLLMLHYHCLKR